MFTLVRTRSGDEQSPDVQGISFGQTLHLFGLAPSGGYLAISITANAGGLLHIAIASNRRLFTLTIAKGISFFTFGG